MNPTDIEKELIRLSERLEEATGELATASEKAAKAEYAFKHAEAMALVELSKVKGYTQDVRKALALVGTAEAHEERLLSAAVRDGTQEACRSLRAQLSSLQSLLRSSALRDATTPAAKK